MVWILPQNISPRPACGSLERKNNLKMPDPWNTPGIRHFCRYFCYAKSIYGLCPVDIASLRYDTNPPRPAGHIECTAHIERLRISKIRMDLYRCRVFWKHTAKPGGFFRHLLLTFPAISFICILTKVGVPRAYYCPWAAPAFLSTYRNGGG